MDRTFRLSRGVIDLDTGVFPATLATNGEASDGHILDIRTLRVDDEMPLFANHDADALTQLGIWQNPRKTGKSTRLGGASLKMDGRIHMEGDSVLGEIRRDVAQRIEVGDIKSMSIRWGHDAETKATPRADLKSSHFAFSDVSGGWETPTFFEHSPAMEASIVGLGADKAALAGRAQNVDVSQPVRDFYRMLLLTGRVQEDTLEEDVLLSLESEEDTRSQEIGDDWEEIELSEGGKFFVPREVSRVWGQSVDGMTGILLRDPETLMDDARAGRLDGVLRPVITVHSQEDPDESGEELGTQGREEPGDSGEELGDPESNVAAQVRETIARIDAMAAHDSALAEKTDAEIADGIKALRFEYRGTL